jgi:hypothetical protein
MTTTTKKYLIKTGSVGMGDMNGIVCGEDPKSVLDAFFQKQMEKVYDSTLTLYEYEYDEVRKENTIISITETDGYGSGVFTEYQEDKYQRFSSFGGKSVGDKMLGFPLYYENKEEVA